MLKVVVVAKEVSCTPLIVEVLVAVFLEVWCVMVNGPASVPLSFTYTSFILRSVPLSFNAKNDIWRSVPLSLMYSAIS